MLYVCSCVLVKLQHLENKDYVKTLSDREHLTEDFVDSFVNHYLKDVVDGSQKEGGWPNWTDLVNSPYGRPAETYSVSKVAVIAYVSALHNTLVAQPGSGKKINVFSCCPGYVATDFNNNRGTKTVEEGADTPVWLALHSPKEGIGKFWAGRKVVDF
jgi:NAD(P)-dependent dehydrogenase (short-subunit alcohol dehydrogenase family)